MRRLGKGIAFILAVVMVMSTFAGMTFPTFAEEGSEDLVIDMASLEGSSDFFEAGYFGKVLKIFSFDYSAKLGDIDLSKYASAVITYGSDSNAMFGDVGTKLFLTANGPVADNQNNDLAEAEIIAVGNLTNSTIGWQAGARTCVIPLDTDYNGPVYLAAKLMDYNGLVVDSIMFTTEPYAEVEDTTEEPDGSTEEPDGSTENRGTFDDLTYKFVSDVASQLEGADLRATDLGEYFNIAYGVGDPHRVENGSYSLGGINEMYADVDGCYTYKINMIESSSSSFAFVRGTRAVESADHTPNGSQAYMPMLFYFEGDDYGYLGGAGIYATIYGGRIHLMLKVYDEASPKHVGNRFYSLPVMGTELTMADNGDTVFIMVSGETVATIDLMGAVNYGKLTVTPYVQFAKRAVVTLMDGTVEELENTLIAATPQAQIGIAARPGTMKFSSLQVLGYEDQSLPEDEKPAYEEKTIPLGLGDMGAPYSDPTLPFGQRFQLDSGDILKSVTVSRVATYNDGNENYWRFRLWQWEYNYDSTVSTDPLVWVEGENHMELTDLIVNIPDYELLGITGDLYYEIEYLAGAKGFTGWTASGGAASGVETYVGGQLRDGTYLSTVTVLGTPEPPDPNESSTDCMFSYSFDEYCEDITQKYGFGYFNETEIGSLTNNGYVTLVSMGMDPYFTFEESVSVPSSQADYLVIKYRTSVANASGEMFVCRTDGVSWASPMEKSCVSFDYIGDGEWHTLIVDASAVWGNVQDVYLNNLRLDFLRSEGIIDISYIKFFATLAGAERCVAEETEQVFLSGEYIEGDDGVILIDGEGYSADKWMKLSGYRGGETYLDADGNAYYVRADGVLYDADGHDIGMRLVIDDNGVPYAVGHYFALTYEDPYDIAVEIDGELYTYTAAALLQPVYDIVPPEDNSVSMSFMNNCEFMAPDCLFYKHQGKNEVTVIGGAAQEYIANELGGRIADVDKTMESFSLQGWTADMGGGRQVATYGYQLNDMEPVFDTAWTRDGSDLDMIFGIDCGSRYKITIDVASLEDGIYNVYPLVMLEDGTVQYMSAWCEFQFVKGGEWKLNYTAGLEMYAKQADGSVTINGKVIPDARMQITEDGAILYSGVFNLTSGDPSEAKGKYYYDVELLYTKAPEIPINPAFLKPVYVVDGEALNPSGDGLGIEPTEYSYENGYITYISNSMDPCVTQNLVPAGTRLGRYMVVKYRTDVKGQSGEIYAGANYYPTGAGDHTMFSYIGDGKWHALVVDLGLMNDWPEDGVVNHFRNDVLREEGVSIDIEYYAFFDTEAEAKYYAEHDVHELPQDNTPDKIYDMYFIADGNVVQIMVYREGDDIVSIPNVPAKEGYVGSWDEYEVDEENGIIYVYAVYRMKTTSAGAWDTYRRPTDYGEEYYTPAPGYQYTDEGLDILPPDYQNTIPYFIVQTTEKDNLKDGMSLTFRVDDYSYGGDEGYYDHWIGLTLWDGQNPSPGSVKHGNGILILLRNPGGGMSGDAQVFRTIEQTATTTGSFDLMGMWGTTPVVDSEGREIYQMEVAYDGTDYYIYVNGVRMNNSAISEYLNSVAPDGNFYVGVSMHTGVVNGTADITITEYNGEIPYGTDSKQPEKNPCNVEDITDPDTVPVGQPAILISGMSNQTSTDYYNADYYYNEFGGMVITPADQVGFGLFEVYGDTSYAAEDFPVISFLVKDEYWLLDTGILRYATGSNRDFDDVHTISWSVWEDYVQMSGENDEYILFTIDMREIGALDWEGRINGLRIDWDYLWLTGGDDSFEICYGGFFRSRSEAQAFYEVYLAERMAVENPDVPVIPDDSEFTPVGDVELGWVGDAADQLDLSDGSAKDWEKMIQAGCNVQEITLSANNFNTWIGEFPEDFEIKAYLIADGDYVYMAFDIVDDDFAYGELSNFYNGDAIQIGMDFGALLLSYKNSMADRYVTPIYYSFSCDGDGAPIRIMRQNTDLEDGILDEEITGGQVKGSSSKTENGWFAEFALSWDLLIEDVEWKAWVEDMDWYFNEESPLFMSMSICYLDRAETGGEVHTAGATFNHNDIPTWTVGEEGMLLYLLWEENRVLNSDRFIQVEPEPEYYGALSGSYNEGVAGDTVEVTLYLDENPGIAYMRLFLEYDKDAMTLVNVENGSILEDLDVGKNLLWSSDRNAYDTGCLVTLTFELHENVAAGDYYVDFYVRECYNADGYVVNLEETYSVISVLDFVYGDVNGDYVVDGRDVILIRQYMSDYDDFTGTSTVEVSHGADVNGDGKINGKDVILLRQYMANYDDYTGESSVVLGPQ